MSEAINKDDLKIMFMDAIRSYIDYWDRQDASSKDKLEGIAFGVLNIIDGTSSTFPCSIDLVLRPHPDDKQYHIENGDDYIEDGTCINTGDYLHDGFFIK